MTRASNHRPAVAFWTLAGVLVAVPLALAPGLQFFDVTPKLLALLLGACLVWAALAAEGRFPALRARHAGFFLLLAGLAAAGVLATIFSRDRDLSLAGSEWRRMGLPAWLACLALAAAVPAVAGEDRARRRGLVAALVLSAVAAAAYSLAQYLGRDPWIDPALYHIGEGEWQIVRPPATLGYVSYFAAFALPAVFAAAGLALSAPALGARLGWGTAAAALTIALLISGSRGAWVGAAAGGLLLLARIRRRRTLLAGLLAVVVLAALFVLSPAGQPVRSRVRWFVEDPAGGARLLLWRDSLRLARAHPLWGAGPETFELSFPGFQSVELAQRVPDRYAESPHNVFLDYLTTAGLPAALLFAFVMATALRNYAIASREVSPDPVAAGDAALNAALLAGLLAALTAAQFISDTIPTRLALLALAGLSVCTPVETATSTARGVVAGIAAVCLALALLFGARLVRADRAVWTATRAIARGDLDGALEAGRVARQAFPWTGAHAFAYSRALGRAVMNPDMPPAQRALLLAVAEDAARTALPHSARPQMVYVHLASLHVLQGKQADAQAALEAAVGAAPAWYRPRWLLAVLLSQRGYQRQAAEQAGAALERGARRHPEIEANCLEIRRLSAR